MNKINICIIIFLAITQLLKGNTINNESIITNYDSISTIIHPDTIQVENRLSVYNVNKDTSAYSDNSGIKQQLKFSYKQLIIPSALIAYGIFETSIEHNFLINRKVKYEVNEHIDGKFTIDDFSQYVPAGSVYALNLLGIKGKNNFKDRTFILGISSIFMATSVNIIKYSTKIERPDQSSKNSFPSGHTAVAFMGAEFLWQEYKDVSKWYGVAGYTIATATGIFRMYNDRHWFSDVIVGAGLGMLSTKAAYWIYPYLQQKFKRKKKSDKQVSLVPFYNGEQVGVSISLSLY